MVQKRTKSATSKPAKLEIDQDMVFQQRYYKVSKVGVILLFLFLLLCMVGLTGSGLLNKRTLSTDESEVRYEPFARQGTSTEVWIDLPASEGKVDIAKVSFDQELIHKYTINSISPEPKDTKLDGSKISYEFSIDNSNAEQTIKFTIEPDSIGLLQGNIGINDGEINFSQFVYL